MSKQAGKIALGLGLITGAITGLLFAPEEGKKIRNKIAKGDTQGLLDDLQAMGEELRDMVVDFSKSPAVVDALDKAKNHAAEAANMKREELDSFLQNVNKKADKMKKKAEIFVKEQKAELDKKFKTKKKKTTAKKKAATQKVATQKVAPKKTVTKKKATPKEKTIPKNK